MTVLDVKQALWADAVPHVPVGELHAMSGEWRTTFVRGSRPSVTAPGGVEWSLKCVHPLPVRRRSIGWTYPPAREGLAYEVVADTESQRETGPEDGWLLELRSQTPGRYTLRVGDDDVILNVGAVKAPDAPVLSTAFGTDVEPALWDRYFGHFHAVTPIQRSDVIKRWHQKLHALGLTPYQPHWWLWIQGRGTTSESGQYYDGQEFSYGSGDEYLAAYGREFMVQSIGLYLRQTRPSVFAPNGVPQDQANLVSFYQAIARWQARTGLKAWVHVDEAGGRYDTPTSMARVRRIAEAGAAAGVMVGGTAFSQSAVTRWADSRIHYGRYVLAHAKWDWQQTPPASVIPSGAELWFYGAARHPAFYMATGGLPAIQMVVDAWRFGAKGILYWAINRMDAGDEDQDPAMKLTGNNVDIWMYPNFGLSLRAYYWREALSFHSLLVAVEKSKGRAAVQAALALLPDVEAVRRALLATAPLLDNTLREAAKTVPFVRINRQAALFASILRDGFIPTSNEFETTFSGAQYIVQRAENAASGEVRLYYVLRGHWAPVRWLPLAA